MAKRKIVGPIRKRIFGWMKIAADYAYLGLAGIIVMTILFSLFHNGEPIRCASLSFFNRIAIAYACEVPPDVRPIGVRADVPPLMYQVPGW